MPRAPKKCADPGCEQRVTGKTYCPGHVKPWQGSTRPGSTRESRRLRDRVLERDPICTCPGCPRCTPTGCSRLSTEDDHLRNLAAGGADDLANHAGKCTPCHRRKTLHEARAGRT